MAKPVVRGFLDGRGEVTASVPLTCFQNARTKAARMGFGWGGQLDGHVMLLADPSHGAALMGEGLTIFSVEGDLRRKHQCVIAAYPCRIQFSNGHEIAYGENGQLVKSAKPQVARKSASMSM